MKYVGTLLILVAGHDWSNWRPLIDDVLLFFYGEAARQTL
jgi:hypothetical protein